MLGALAALTGVAVARPRVELPRTQTIVEEIRPLEGARDPTCHATASRLEDLSYGTVAHREQTDEIASHLRAVLTLGGPIRRPRALRSTISITRHRSERLPG
jgi:hypothetical protein